MSRTLETGDKKRIIQSHDAEGDEYVLNVEGGNIRIAHSEKTTKDGTLIKDGDRVKLKNLRGKPLFAEAIKGTPEIEIDRAGVDVVYMQRVDLGSVSETIATNPTDRSTREVGKVRVEESDGTLIDPIDSADSEPITATTSSAGEANAAQLQLGNLRTYVDVAYDLSGVADIVVEGSTDGADWWELDRQSDDSARGVIPGDTAFEYVRAYATANLNEIEMSSKGV